MKSVKIIKRATEERVEELPPRANAKTTQQTTREMVSTVKAWIAEWEQQHRASQRAAVALLR